MGLGAIFGGLGLISSLMQNESARKSASKANSKAGKLDDRLVKLFDVLFSNAETADKAGQFDPEKRIASLERDTSRYEGQDMGNLAGALRVSGYKPGDSEIGTRLDAVKGKYRSFLDTMRDQIRQNSFTEKQNAYASANPNILGGPLQDARQSQAMSLSQIQNPSGFLSSFLPMLGRGRSSGFNIGGNRSPASTGY